MKYIDVIINDDCLEAIEQLPDSCVESGRHFVLMEQDEGYYFKALKRIEDAQRRYNTR